MLFRVFIVTALLMATCGTTACAAVEPLSGKDRSNDISGSRVVGASDGAQEGLPENAQGAGITKLLPPANSCVPAGAHGLVLEHATNLLAIQVAAAKPADAGPDYMPERSEARGSCTPRYYYDGPEVAFFWTAPANGTLILDTAAEPMAFAGKPLWHVRDGCGSAAEVACAANALSVAVLQGVTYTIFADVVAIDNASWRTRGASYAGLLSFTADAT